MTLLRQLSHFDSRSYKQSLLRNGIQWRMRELGISTMDAYASHVFATATEASALVARFLIHFTCFFRDPCSWETLRRRAVAPLVESCGPGDVVRAWVPACATGEEAYSLAMLFAEEFGRAGKPPSVKIFASDVSETALAQARSALYPGSVETELSRERLGRFFYREGSRHRVVPTLREMLVFSRQDLLHDPPIGRVHLVTCRNMLIYLEPEARLQAFSNLHDALRQKGLLFLGASEDVPEKLGLFARLDARQPIFGRLEASPDAGARPPARRLRQPATSPPDGDDLAQPLSAARDDPATSQEEMRSLNEQLSAVNSLLRETIEEQRADRDGLLALLTSADLGLVFLDRRMHVRRYTPAILPLIHLIPADVGRSLFDLTLRFTDPDLGADAERALATHESPERAVPTANGRHYLRRILPYRTDDGRIDGVVLTFVDITARKRVEDVPGNTGEMRDFLTKLAGPSWPLGGVDELKAEAARILGGQHPSSVGATRCEVRTGSV